MHADATDLVRVTTGDLTGMQIAHDVLKDAGIDSRVVGGDLTAGFGTALLGSVELWVHRSDLAKAEAELAASDRHHPKPERQTHPHPTDDPKPDHSRGPTHGAPPHRPLPS